MLGSVSTEKQFGAVVISVHTGTRPPDCASSSFIPLLTIPPPASVLPPRNWTQYLPGVVKKMVTTQETCWVGMLPRVQEMPGTCQVTPIIFVIVLWMVDWVGLEPAMSWDVWLHKLLTLPVISSPLGCPCPHLAVILYSFLLPWGAPSGSQCTPAKETTLWEPRSASAFTGQVLQSTLWS